MSALLHRPTFSAHLPTCHDEKCPGCEPDNPIARARRRIAELEKELEEAKKAIEIYKKERSEHDR
jgi:hypothetical protein